VRNPNDRCAFDGCGLRFRDHLSWQAAQLTGQLHAFVDGQLHPSMPEPAAPSPTAPQAATQSEDGEAAVREIVDRWMWHWCNSERVTPLESMRGAVRDGIRARRQRDEPSLSIVQKELRWQASLCPAGSGIRDYWDKLAERIADAIAKEGT